MTTAARGPAHAPVSVGAANANMSRLRKMQVGSLVRYTQTDTLHLVTFFDVLTCRFHLDGWGDFDFGPLTEIEVISADR